MIAEKVLDIEKGLTDIVRKNSQFVTAQLRYLNKKWMNLLSTNIKCY